MKRFLIGLGVVFFVGPFLFWMFISELACGMGNYSGKPCPPVDFLDEEFAMIATMPWMIALICFLGAWSARAPKG